MRGMLEEANTQAEDTVEPLWLYFHKSLNWLLDTGEAIWKQKYIVMLAFGIAMVGAQYQLASLLTLQTTPLSARAEIIVTAIALLYAWYTPRIIFAGLLKPWHNRMQEGVVMPRGQSEAKKSITLPVVCLASWALLAAFWVWYYIA